MWPHTRAVNSLLLESHEECRQRVQPQQCMYLGETLLWLHHGEVKKTHLSLFLSQSRFRVAW